MTDDRPDAGTFDTRTLDPAAAQRYLDAPITDEERAEVLALVRWFARRYPAPIDRLAYARAAYARWRRTLGVAGHRHA
jgi:hypothetical protein